MNRWSMNRWSWIAGVGILVCSAAGARAQNDAPVPPFKDVPESHWAFQAVENLRQKGILRGYPDAGYRGKRTITRYETAEAIARVTREIGMRTPRETAFGPPGDPGPRGPRGERGPKGEPGPRGEAPPEVSLFRAAIEEMRKELSTVREQLDAADRKIGPLQSETRRLKKDASPVRTGR